MKDEQTTVMGPESTTDNLYEGYRIPSFLKLVYVIFISWALVYLVKFLVPDLSAHLH